MSNLPTEKAIIPQPVELSHQTGTFTIAKNTSIECQPACKNLAQYLVNFLRTPMGYELSLKEGECKLNASGPSIRLSINTTKSAPLPAEGYLLTITPQNISIEGKDLAGLFYGIQSLRQLLPVQIEAAVPQPNMIWSVPCVTITDYPRFAWRGFMLDECRHFFGKVFVKRMIDLCALYKINKLHWHLTEDEGWRIEIKRFPKLTEIAGKRQIAKKWRETPNLDDPKWYGGFYTQAEIKEVIEYARQRFIEVFPEIEMPGHATAPLVAYPEFSCAVPPKNVPTIGDGKNRHAYCAGKPETYRFLQDVLDEVFTIFDSDKIHIGGDELPTERWKACPRCQAFMKQQKLENLDMLQVYFAAQMIKFNASKGKTTIGWFDFPVDRLLDQGVDANRLIFQFWVGSEKKMIDFVRKGGKAIVSYHRYCYMDYPYWGIPLKKAYCFEPIPAELESQYHAQILGIEPLIWCERVPNWLRMDFQVFPRLLAYAETAWTPAALKDYKQFLVRLKPMLERLDLLCVHYAPLAEATNAFSRRLIPRGLRNL